MVAKHLAMMLESEDTPEDVRRQLSANSYLKSSAKPDC